MANATFLIDHDLSIGRDPANDICISAKAVSRQHSVVRPEEGGCRIVDLGSRNGTFVNDMPVTEQKLAHGDSISISSAVFVFLSAEQEPENPRSGTEWVNAQGQMVTATLHPHDAFRLEAGDFNTRLWAGLAQKLDSILQFNKKISAIRDPASLQRTLLSHLLELTPADYVASLLFDELDGPPVSIVGLERSGVPVETVVLSSTITGQVLRQNVAVLIENVDRRLDFLNAKSVELHGFKSVLAVPLTARGRTFGIVYLDIRHSDRQFDRSDLELATGVAAVAALALENALQFERLRKQTEILRSEVNRELKMVGTASAMQSVYRLIFKVGASDSTVLLTGESGTGKELAARAVHNISRRAERPFVAMNCATLSEHLLESDLFGYERGAFTGAVTAKQGQLEIANGGTLFLDEVGELPLAVQGKLLRVLQEREFFRVGGTRSIRVDIRIIAATNRVLRDAVSAGKFRDDLWHRLNVIGIKLPPLRERLDDIGPLANYFIARSNQKGGRVVTGLSPKALNLLLRYNWPGNVRELENAIEYAVVLGEDEEIQPHDLPESIWESAAVASLSLSAPSYEAAVRDFKRSLVLGAMQQADGNYSEAAKQLSVHVNYLHRLIRVFGMRPELIRLRATARDSRD